MTAMLDITSWATGAGLALIAGTLWCLWRTISDMQYRYERQEHDLRGRLIRADKRLQQTQADHASALQLCAALRDQIRELKKRGPGGVYR